MIINPSIHNPAFTVTVGVAGRQLRRRQPLIGVSCSQRAEASTRVCFLLIPPSTPWGGTFAFVLQYSAVATMTCVRLFCIGLSVVGFIGRSDSLVY